MGTTGADVARAQEAADPAPPIVEVIEDPAALPGIAAAWDALIPPAHPGAVFRSGAWLGAWWRAFGRGRALRVYVARRGGRLVGALPGWSAPSRLGPRTFRLLGDNVVASDHLGAITTDLVAVRAIAARLLDEEEDVQLGGLDADEPLLIALDEIARARGFVLRVAPLGPAPYLDLRAAGSLSAYLDARPGGAGAQLRRRRRWLEKQPGFRLDIAEREDDIDPAIDALLRLHAMRWADAGGSAGIPDEPVRRFHREAARALAREGRARVYLLHVEGQVRAAFYGFASGPRFSFYQSGNDPAWRARSVGTVVLGAALEDAFARGLAEFDFLRGDEDYKRTFATHRRALVRASVACSLRARAVRGVEAAARRTARTLLSDDNRARLARFARRGAEI